MPASPPLLYPFDCYVLLGLQPTATGEEIEAAYRAACAAAAARKRPTGLAWLADLWLGRTDKARRDAYETLSDPQRRAYFDEHRRRHSEWVMIPF